MKKEVFLVLGVIFLITAGAFAETISDGAVSKEVEDYIKAFVSSDGINSENIKGIKKIDQSNLPPEVEIKKIDKNKVGIYEVNYSEENVSKKVFVVTYSSDELAKEIGTKNIQNYNFGYVGKIKKPDYLNSAGGVKTGKDAGYVMIREGSITGISTSLEISGSGKLYVKVYKNGEDTGFANVVSSSDVRKIDYDLQSEEVVTFEAGDVLSVYVEPIGEVTWGEVTTIVEVIN